jgi:hypothetical protein
VPDIEPEAVPDAEGVEPEVPELIVLEPAAPLGGVVPEEPEVLELVVVEGVEGEVELGAVVEADGLVEPEGALEPEEVVVSVRRSQPASMTARMLAARTILDGLNTVSITVPFTKIMPGAASWPVGPETFHGQPA